MIWETAVAEDLQAHVVGTLVVASACQEIAGSEMITTKTKSSCSLKVVEVGAEVGAEKGATFLPDTVGMMETSDLATNTSTRATMTTAMGMATDMTKAMVRAVAIIRFRLLPGVVVVVLDVLGVGIPEEEEVEVVVINIKVSMPRFRKWMPLTLRKMLLDRHSKTLSTTPRRWSKRLSVDAAEEVMDIRTLEGGDLAEEEEVALFQDGQTL